MTLSLHDGTQFRTLTAVSMHDGTQFQTLSNLWMHDGTEFRLVFTSGTTAYLYPSSDVSDGDWTNESNRTNNIYNVVDEATRDDADYLKCVDGSGGNPVKLGLPSPAGTPISAKLKYTHWMDGTFINGDGKIGVWEGTTEIASVALDDTSGAWVPSSGLSELTIPVGSVSDWANVEIWIYADTGVGGGGSYPTEQRCSICHIEYVY